MNFSRVHTRVTKGRLGFGLGLLQSRAQRLLVRRHAHAFAATAAVALINTG